MRKVLTVLTAFSLVWMLSIFMLGCDNETTYYDPNTGAVTTPEAPHQHADLSTPALKSPPNGETLYHIPRETTLLWGDVDDAARYGVEVQYDSTGSNTWQGLINEMTTASSYTFTFSQSVPTNGSRTARWRIWAVDSLNNDGPQSDWSSIIYKN